MNLEEKIIGEITGVRYASFSNRLFLHLSLNGHSLHIFAILVNPLILHHLSY